VRGYPELEVVVRELLENAVEHGAGQGERPARSSETAGDSASEHHRDGHAGADQADASVVAIYVTVEHRDDVVVLRVTDDGPGVPGMERAVLEQGMEEPLSHSQGLGPWVVRAIVGDSGGDLSVRDADAGGTTVEIELAAATPPERAASHRQTV
jgi:signal transduction histidine kinase